MTVRYCRPHLFRSTEPRADSDRAVQLARSYANSNEPEAPAVRKALAAGKPAAWRQTKMDQMEGRPVCQTMGLEESLHEKDGVHIR